MQVPYRVSIASPSPGARGSSTSWRSSQPGPWIVTEKRCTRPSSQRERLRSSSAKSASGLERAQDDCEVLADPFERRRLDALGRLVVEEAQRVLDRAECVLDTEAADLGGSRALRAHALQPLNYGPARLDPAGSIVGERDVCADQRPVSGGARHTEHPAYGFDAVAQALEA